MLAYAYILTHEVYPTIFYRDYEEWLNKAKLNNLILIHNNKGTRNASNLWIDNDEYIASINGYYGIPAKVVYIDNSNFRQERWIDTNRTNTKIKDYTGNSTWQPTTATNKRIKIQVRPNNYLIWSPL